MLEKEERPDPALTVEALGRTESETQAALGCSPQLWQLFDQQQAEGGLERVEGGSELDQLRACFAVAEERWEEPERGGSVRLVC